MKTTHDTDQAIEMLKEAAQLISEAAGLLGRDSLALRVSRAPDRHPKPKPQEPTHKPTRHPERPFPAPEPGALGEPLDWAPAVRLPITGFSLEVDRRMAFVFSSGLHIPEPEKLLWRIEHHSDCSSIARGQACDCGFVLKFRKSPEGQTFVVLPDGIIETCSEPMSPAMYSNNPVQFYAARSWDVRTWFNDCINEEPEYFTIVGEGDDERFLELPGEVEIPTTQKS